MSIHNVLLQYRKYKNNYIESIKKEVGFKNKFKKRLPNMLTKSRFIAPFIIIPIALSNLTTALIATILFALTDAFDGYFARKWNAYSDYGRILDPICDKMFAIGVALPILITNPFLMISTILLECGISIINLNSSSKNNNPKSTYIGKFKTVILSVNLILSYLNIMDLKITIFTNLIQLVTAIDYYSIDRKKDKDKEEAKDISCVNIEESDNQKSKIASLDYENKFNYNNKIQKEKNELLELRKTFMEEPVELGRQNTKKA